MTTTCQRADIPERYAPRAERCHGVPKVKCEHGGQTYTLCLDCAHQEVDRAADVREVPDVVATLRPETTEPHNVAPVVPATTDRFTS